MHFPLHPDTPQAGRSLEELFAGRGYDVPKMQAQMRARMTAEGLPYGDRKMTFNSRLAQELGAWADTQPGGEAIHDALFRAYFVDGRNIGDPAVLYVGMVHPEGPAHQAGLAHGDEILAVDGTATTGKSYEQVVKMIRGTVGTVVKLGVKGEGGMRELSITRVAGDKLPKGPAGSHGGPSK